MPSTRPRAQGNHRSPAKPTSPFIPASSTPTFLPPSHYAAAAGISYQTVRDHAPSQDSYYSRAQPSSSMTRSSMAPSGGSTYIPLTMPSPPPESVSFSPDHGQSKRSFLKRRPSRSDNTMNRNSSNRQSQLGDLPMVEAQLLPSLRDTIDKMTNTSKTTGDPSSPNSLPPHRDPPTNRLSFIQASPSPSRSLSNSLRRPAVTPKTTPIPPMPLTPKPASGLNAGRSPRIPVATSKVKPKPILKSVFSGSSSTTMAGSSKVPEPSSPSKLSQSKPSRLVKSVLGKKPARGTPETSSVSTTHKTSGSVASFPFRDHGRSRTDPGSTSKIPSRSPHLSRTPQAIGSYSSSHPHPMPANSSQRNVKHPGASSGESGPELELRSERGRALVVTNADIIASSSESSSEIDGDQVADDIPPDIQPAWMRPATISAYNMSRPRVSRLPDGIGLGFGVPEAHVREPYDARRGNRRSSTNRSRGEDETSVYLDGEAWETVDVSMDSAPYSGAKNKFHRKREMAYANRSSSSALPNPWEAGDGMLEDSVRRRHDALMGIVNELEIGLSTNDGKRDSEDSFESEYMGQEGLAISGSTDIQSQTVSSGESFGAHHGRQRSIARPSPQSRQRSHAYSPNAHAVDAKSPSASYGTPRWSHYPNGQSNALVTLTTTNHEDSGQDDEISASEYASEDGEDDDFHFEEVTPTISGSLRQSRPYSAASRSRTSTESPSRLAKPSRANNLALSPINTSLRPSLRSVVDSRAPTAASTSLANDRHQRDSVPALKRHSRHNDDGPYIPSDASVYSTGERFISETYSHHQSMNFVEAREREAFGLPPSVSNDSDIISHAQSVSSLDIRRCQDEGDEFSSGAEAIFKKLSYETDPHYLEETPGFRGDGEGHVQGTHDYEDVPMSGEDSVINVHPSQTQTTLSRSSSANSIYEDCTPARSWQHHQQDPHILDQNAEGRTWRSTLPSSAHRSLLERYGEMEMERQEIIWEICESEETFVKRLRVVVELFIRPLRLQNSRSWISGVPPDIARLFDWLEDIVNLHSQLFAALRVARAGQYPLVMRIAEVLRGFVPRLEVHQPYLVRIDEVVAMIKMMTGENGDDFGEFIRIQEERACQGWSLETVLLEPVSRLSQYPMRFKRLWDATPQTHLDHISTFSLLHSSETMIRVMREVRIREEEYDLVKDIMNRIEGLPPSVQLASRERRLLARGRFLRISGNDKIRGTRGANPVYPSFAGTPASTRDRSVQRQSRLLNALQGWKASSSARSDSLRSMTSSNFSGDSGLTVASSTPPITPMSLGHDVASISRSGKWSGSSPGTSRRYDLSTGSASLWNDPAKHSPVHVFVFTDLVVLASPTQSASRARAANRTSNLTADNGVEKETWRLLNDIGICRILGITGEEQNIALDLLPMDTEDLETGVIPDSVPVASVTLTIPPSSSSGKVLDSASLEDISAKWLSAFQQCFQYTLRALSFPSHSGKYLAQGPNVDVDLDSRQSVMAILASGLPLPKSPSIQIEETMLGIAGSIEQQEREERGWWSVRFQQVLREMQRDDLSFAEAPGSLASRSMDRAGPSRSLSSVSRPRRPKLPSLASSESAVMSTPVAANRSRLG